MSDKISKETDGVFRAIRQIVARGGDYIFRGETKDYGNISSTLYRAYEYVLRTEKVAQSEAHRITMDDIQKQIIADAKEYSDEKNDDAILENAQHDGVEINRIGFSHDYLIALFFACEWHHNENGRLILYNTHSIDRTEVRLIELSKPHKHLIAQKSIFVSPKSGVLDVEQENIIIIPATSKERILDFLLTEHNITANTIYHDIHSYMSHYEIHNKADIHLYRGYYYCKTRSYQDAIDEYAKAIELDPQSAAAYHDRGFIHKELEEYPHALADYDKAIELEPQMTDAYYGRGLVYEEMDECEKAIADYTEVITRNPQEINAYRNRAICYHTLALEEQNKKKRHEYYAHTLKDYTTAIKLDPQLIVAYYARGIVYKKLHEHEKAIADFNKAIELDPQLADACYSRAGCYHALALGEQNEEKRHTLYTRTLEDYYTVVEHSPHDIDDYCVLFDVCTDFCSQEKGDAEKQRVHEILQPIVDRALRLVNSQGDKRLKKQVQEYYDEYCAQPSSSTPTEEQT